jgi:hypothetical protein
LLDASDNCPRESAECCEDCSQAAKFREGCAEVAWECDEDCAECATYASEIVTGSVPVRFEKWNRNVFPEKQARIG